MPHPFRAFCGMGGKVQSGVPHPRNAFVFVARVGNAPSAALHAAAAPSAHGVRFDGFVTRARLQAGHNEGRKEDGASAPESSPSLSPNRRPPTWAAFLLVHQHQECPIQASLGWGRTKFGRKPNWGRNKPGAPSKHHHTSSAKSRYLRISSKSARFEVISRAPWARTVSAINTSKCRSRSLCGSKPWSPRIFARICPESSH
jgi:hypothetical protein